MNKEDNEINSFEDIQNALGSKLEEAFDLLSDLFAEVNKRNASETQDTKLGGNEND
jgi:hypothetical protein